MDLGLKGLRAAVTGGTRGIGRAIAERLAEEGCDVAICARTAGEVSKAVAALRGKGVRTTGRALDVADGEALKGWIQAVDVEFGGLDILVANASGFAEGHSPDAFKRAFEVDLMHTVNAVEAALPHLERSKAGAIVAIASISGVEDYGIGDAAYGTGKAALLYYMKTLANHVVRKGVRANVVSPGSIFFEGGFWDRAKRDMPDVYEATLAGNPMGRLGRPEEIANAVAFVASPAASFMAGANVVVDGACTRRIQN